jgi:putative autotransporter adhesin-like protein
MADQGGGAGKVIAWIFGGFCLLSLVCCGGAVLMFGVSEDSFVAVAGSGVPASETRDVTGFTGVLVAGSTDLEIVVGEDFSVALHADDNVLPLIVTEVVGTTLKISTTDSYSSGTDVRAVITMPAIAEVMIHGSGDIDVRGISGARFRAKIEGSGDVIAVGTVDVAIAEVSGSGDIDFYDLASTSAEVVVQGVGDVTVNASKELDVRIDGVGDVTYRGTPQVTKQISGVGSVTPRGD